MSSLTDGDEGYSLSPNTVNFVLIGVYLIGGGILVALSTIFIIAILITERFRRQKELMIVAANLFFDFGYSLAYFLSGVKRIDLYIHAGYYLSKTNRWACLLQPSSFIFAYVSSGVGIVSFFTCIDRYMAVIIPLRYRQFGYRYGIFFTCCVLCLPLTILFYAAVTSFQRRDIRDTSESCTLAQSVIPSVNYLIRGIRLTTSLLSVFVYALIAKKVFKIFFQKNYTITNSMHRTQHMTITLSLLTLSEFVLNAIPDMITIVLSAMNSSNTPVDQQFRRLFEMFYICYVMKGGVNLVIIFSTQKELRRFLFSKLGCQKHANKVSSINSNQPRLAEIGAIPGDTTKKPENNE